MAVGAPHPNAAMIACYAPAKALADWCTPERRARA